MRKLTDSQVKTMIHILAYSPDAPTNLERFPTLQMMLDEGIIYREPYLSLVDIPDGMPARTRTKLVFNTRCPENAYQYVVPTDLVSDGANAPSFDELEKAGLLKFNPSAEPRETTETDEEYRLRLIDALVPNAVMTSVDIVNASVEGLNAIGTSLKCYRLVADTFYYYDCVVLCNELEKLGAEVDRYSGRIVAKDNDECATLITAFKAKYPPILALDGLAAAFRALN